MRRFRGRRTFRRGRRYSGVRRFRRRYATKRMLAPPRPRRSLIFRYGNAGDVPEGIIYNGQSVGWFSVALNDIHYPVRYDWSGGAMVAPTILPAKDEWFQFYARWKVNMVDISFDLSNRASGRNFYFGYILDSKKITVSANPGLSWGDLMLLCKTNMYCGMKFVGANGAANSRNIIKAKLPIAKAIGLSTYRTDLDYLGGSPTAPATSPSKLVQLYLFIANEQGNAETTDMHFTMNLKLTFYCTMSGRDWETS